MPVSFTTVDGVKFENATVTLDTPMRVKVISDAGIERVNFARVPEELREKFGFDLEKARLYLANRKARAEATKIRNAEYAVVYAQNMEKTLERRSKKLASLQRMARLEQRLFVPTRESQLQGVMAMRFSQRRGPSGPMSLGEYQFLSDDAKNSIILNTPGMVPVEILDQ